MRKSRHLLGTVTLTLALAAALLPVSASALTISPPSFDYNLNPGDTVLDVVKVYNENETTEIVYPVLVDFVADEGEAGAPRFVPAGTDAAGAGISDWISMDMSGLVVAPDERINFPFSINVPADASPGGHYGAILLSTEPPSDVPGGVGVASQIAALILVNVSGDVREVGAIAEFGFVDPQVWYDHLPIDFFLRFENSGNTHLRPSGNLFVEDWTGRQVASIKVNESFNGVLPMSIRRFQFGWQKRGFDTSDSGLEREWKNFAIGKHTATLVLNYGRATGQVVSEQRVFYVWPWRLMIVSGIVLLILAVLWVIRRKMFAKGVIARYEEAKRKEAALRKG